ncbi:MAG: hypothetical protein R3F65_05845 [bacterium]
MNADERKRLEALKQQRTTAQLLKQLLGVDPSDSYLEGRFRGFLRSTMLWANEKWNPRRSIAVRSSCSWLIIDCSRSGRLRRGSVWASRR